MAKTKVTVTKIPTETIATTEKKTAYAATDSGSMGGMPVKGKPFGIGVVVEGEAGYHPVADYAFSTFALAEACAQRFNDRLNTTAEQAAMIVVSSLRAQNVAARRARR